MAQPCVTRPARGLPVAAEDLGRLGAGPRPAVDGVSLRVAPGERLAVVGPNGAGKTTLLRLLAGLLRPDRGRALVGGRDLAAMGARERARTVAVVSQAELPDPRLVLADYVALGRLPHRGRTSDARHRAAVAAALGRLGLDGLARRRLGELSGGERQRGAIARALAQEPAVLVLDEPTNHLDPRARADVLAAVRALDATVVAALHDLQLADGFADRVAVLSSGRLAALGPPASALAPERVRQVFGMHSFRVRSPASGRDLVVIETPTPEPSEHGAP